ncbi:UDP-glucose 4-epimerase GalE [Geothrix paludis]|uniref:UDP-glucose 4-epimerase GalE n=1 Tax=Geothrix paludis TaxID=2922722 RepID=UPI001FACD2C7|nr:UDP-glucose 4-epimerase GalE [Geothrix paludis]
MSNPDTILVTGGAGFIGSHTVVELLQAGYAVVALDNFANAKPSVISRICTLAGRDFTFVEGDVRDPGCMAALFRDHPIQTVIHFAGLKAVGESTRVPLTYYQNNVTGTLNLLEAMRGAGCRNLVFSSSATVYGDPAEVPIREDSPLSATNPYGRSKLMIEEICRDLAKSEPGWRIALLRYFNPVGAHPSGLLGEDPQGVPNNLMPYLLQVASGHRPHLEVFGQDYPTPDGTGVRDYLHVVDLALGHLAALKALPRIEGAIPINLGTGRGYSVLEMIQAMEKVMGHPIPWQFGPRRPGDIALCYANPDRAHTMLGWRAERDLMAMCSDGLTWIKSNSSLNSALA